MDTHQKVIDWLKAMGYVGKVPNLKPLCNPATALIWEQLVSKVKPKQEIEHIRNNILINRLQRNNETCNSAYTVAILQADLDFPIKEVEVWKKKQSLERQRSSLESRIDELKVQINRFRTDNNIKYLTLVNSKRKITENDQCTVLLDTKTKALAEEVTEVEKMLSYICNLTPVESDRHNKMEVVETLKKCSEKLEKIIQKQQHSKVVVHPISDAFGDVKTPRIKLFQARRGFTSVKKCNMLSTAKKIQKQKFKQGDLFATLGHVQMHKTFSISKRKPNLDDSLGFPNDLTFDNALATSSFKEPFLVTENACCDLAILNDDALNQTVEEVLHKNNQLDTWHALISMSEVCRDQMVCTILENDKKVVSDTNKTNAHVPKLHATHIEYVLKSLKLDHSINKFKGRIAELHNSLAERLGQNSSSEKNEELISYIKLQQKELGLDAVNQFRSTLLHNMRDSTKRQDDLVVVKEQARDLEENLNLKLSTIENKLTGFKQTYESLMQCRSEASMLVRKLSRFTKDLDWTLPLWGDAAATEATTFFEFPLEYNRQFTMGGETVFVRDLPIVEFPYQEDFNTNLAHILATVLQSPQSSPTVIILNIMKAKYAMEQYKSLKVPCQEVAVKGYTLEQLRSQEAFVQCTVNRLKSLIQSASTAAVNTVEENMKEIMTFWLEMPVRHFVSPRRLFNGQPYSHYEALYENFYTQLELEP